jgi:type IV pilus assembly protein PilX
MKRSSSTDTRRAAHRLVQRGVSLLFALLALAAMSLAAVALVRSVDGGSLVIGNLSFKQDTTRAADSATEVARNWIATSGADMSADGAAGTGYYAQAHTNLDPTGQHTSASNLMDVVDWGDANSCTCAGATCALCLAPSNDLTFNGGNVRANYLITRLCPNSGAVVTGNACAQPVSLPLNTSPDKGELNPQGGIKMPSSQAPYYRIIVRTVGGRNTVSFTETIVQ